MRRLAALHCAVCVVFGNCRASVMVHACVRGVMGFASNPTFSWSRLGHIPWPIGQAAQKAACPGRRAAAGSRWPVDRAAAWAHCWLVTQGAARGWHKTQSLKSSPAQDQ